MLMFANPCQGEPVFIKCLPFCYANKDKDEYIFIFHLYYSIHAVLYFFSLNMTLS